MIARCKALSRFLWSSNWRDVGWHDACQSIDEHQSRNLTLNASLSANLPTARLARLCNISCRRHHDIQHAAVTASCKLQQTRNCMLVMPHVRTHTDTRTSNNTPPRYSWTNTIIKTLINQSDIYLRWPLTNERGFLLIILSELTAFDVTTFDSNAFLNSC